MGSPDCRLHARQDQVVQTVCTKSAYEVIYHPDTPISAPLVVCRHPDEPMAPKRRPGCCRTGAPPLPLAWAPRAVHRARPQARSTRWRPGRPARPPTTYVRPCTPSAPGPGPTGPDSVLPPVGGGTSIVRSPPVGPRISSTRGASSALRRL